VSRVNVTEAESEVLAALWRRGSLSFVSLIEEVKTVQPWGDATIKTLLHRLITKGAVRSVREDGRQRYHPLLTREDFIRVELRSLTDRFLAGDAAALRRILDEGI
jgi:BlaI family penicillinase repressor